MSRPTILKAIPVVILTAACLILGGIMIAKNTGSDTLPTMAETDGASAFDTQTEETVESDGTEAEQIPETEPPETDPPKTEPVVIASGGLEFTTLGNGTCYVSGAGSCRDSFIILPDVSPYGEKVIGIGDYAFRNCKFIKCVELSDSLKFVGAYAFYGTEIVNAYVPHDLEQIGDFAFGNCGELENITVSPDNTAYCDVGGVLYSKDGKKLICYPGGRSESNVAISSLVEEISTMAFYNCSFVKVIDYEGSVSSFRRIKVGAGNETFENAVITYFTGNINSNTSNNREK